MCETYVYVLQGTCESWRARSFAAPPGLGLPRSRASARRARRRPRSRPRGRPRAVSSSRAWLIPAREGAKIIAAGSTRATSAASWRAPLARLAGSPATAAQAARAAATSPGRRGSARSARPATPRARSRARPRPPRSRARAAASIRAERLGLGVAEVDREHRPPGDGGRDPGLEAQLAGGRDAALGGRDRLDRERGLGRGEAGVVAARPSASSPRARPGRANAKPQPLDPGAAGRPPRRAGPRPPSPAPARCGARGRRRGPRGGRAQSPSARELDAVLGEHLGDRAPVGVAQRARRSAGSSVPANAELPNRLRPKRAPSSSAQSTSTSGRGGGSPARAQARRTPSAAITPSAPSSQPPSGTESRCEPSASAGAAGRAPSSRAQRLPASSGSASSADLGEQLAEERARLAPGRRPAEPLRAALVAGPPGELAQVGDHPRRVDRRRRRHRAQPRLAVERLGEAVGAAAAQREHREVGVEDLEAEARAAAR